MSTDVSNPDQEREMLSPVRALANQAFSRASGAPLISGNKIRLLKDARENYPAWLDAIRAAKQRIYFESYIIYDDAAGRMFADALTEKAKEGVQVRLIYDWLGGLGTASRAFWNRLRAAGAQVRCFNPARWDSPLGWLSRDHRKTLCVDGEAGFVSGLCVGQMWLGEPAKKIEAWRDTGVEVRGPSVADLERAFASVWAMIGEPIAKGEMAGRNESGHEGERGSVRKRKKSYAKRVKLSFDQARAGGVMIVSFRSTGGADLSGKTLQESHIPPACLSRTGRVRDGFAASCRYDHASPSHLVRPRTRSVAGVTCKPRRPDSMVHVQRS